MDDEKVIDYVMKSLRGCRDCADSMGVCPHGGNACEPKDHRKSIAHTINSIRYGVAEGYIDNPIQVRRIDRAATGGRLQPMIGKGK